MKLLRRGAVTAGALFICAGALASADPVDVTLAVTVNALTGTHQVSGGQSDSLRFAPLPLGELNVRRNADSIRIEGLPPVTFGYFNATDSGLSTRLSIVNATYRHAFAGGWFAGAGQTVYNQSSTFVPADGNVFSTNGSQFGIGGSEVQYSRVTGARFELGRIAQSGRNRVEWWAAANPRMRGIAYTRLQSFRFVCGSGGISRPCNPVVATFADPENASQVDLSARVAHRIARNGEVLLGLRYLNYTAHYDNFPGQLADRNVGFAPTLGYRIKL
ncbi:MAG: hypothetical protein M3154_02900 [Candidatus Eremiobacteraeota bacterium]|nr:hypothetical protein [Candidatus Eremiobacteraeota bacterium]